CWLEVGYGRCLTPVGCQTPWMAGGAAARALCLLSGGRVVGVSEHGAFGVPRCFVRGGWVRCVIPGGSQTPAIGFSAGWCLTPWRESDTWTWAAWTWAAWTWAARGLPGSPPVSDSRRVSDTLGGWRRRRARFMPVEWRPRG